MLNSIKIPRSCEKMIVVVLLGQEGDIFVFFFYVKIHFALEGFLQTFHLKIFFNLNSISTAFQNVFSQCPQCGLCLKFAADPSDKNFNNEFVPEGEEGILNCSGKMLMTMLAMMIRVRRLC